RTMQRASRRSSPATRRPSSTSGSCSTTKASTSCLRLCARSTRAQSSSGSATTARSSSGSRRRVRSSRGHSSTVTFATCFRLRTSPSSRRSSRRRSGWSPQKRRLQVRRRSLHGIRVSRRSPKVSRPSIRNSSATLRASAPVTPWTWRGSCGRSLRCLRKNARRSGQQQGALLSSGGAGRASPKGCSRPFKYDSRVGDAQRLAPDEQIAFARDAFENAEDLTVAVEEEFALLDPDTLELTNRFEELKEAAAGTELDEHLVGELIASEIEVKTGRCL